MSTNGQSNSGPDTNFSGEPPAISAAEFQALTEMVGMDMPDVLVDLLDTYLVESTGLVENMTTALVQNDLPAMMRPAHSLKSSSASIGALQLSHLCADLESHLRGGTVTVDIPRQVEAIAYEFGRVHAELEEAKIRLLKT